MRSKDGHLCVDEGDMFISIIAPIKNGQKGRFESFGHKRLPYLIQEWVGNQHFRLPYGFGLFLALSDIMDNIL